MTDGPLIVQSDKTLLLEVDHELADECRRAIAPFAELERSPEHVHTYRITPLGPVERPRRRPRRRAGRQRPADLQPLRRPPRAARRRRRDHGALRPADACSSTPSTGSSSRPPTGRCSRRSSAPRRCGRSLGERVDADTVVVHPSERGTSSRCCSSSAGRPRTSPATSTARRTPIELVEDGWELRAYQREAVDGFWHGGSGVVVLPCGAGKTIVGAAAMAQAGATTLILVTNTVVRAAVEARAAQADDADRGRDRRVLGRPQGDPAGHDRDVPGHDDAPEGRLRPPRALRRARLGPDHLRRGAPAARRRSSASPPTSSRGAGSA